MVPCDNYYVGVGVGVPRVGIRIAAVGTLSNAVMVQTRQTGKLEDGCSKLHYVG